MTGFGSHHKSTLNQSITVEVKTLNSKFLDLSFKFPRLLSAKELDLRKLISHELIRGKISVNIQLEALEAEKQGFLVNETLFLEHVNNLILLESASGRKFHDLLKIALEAPDVQTQSEELLTEPLWQEIEAVVQTALSNCAASRAEEGAKLADILSNYIKNIKSELTEIINIEPSRLPKLKEKLRHTIQELLSSKEYDKERLEQELIFYSEKYDINEEIERLKIHLDSYLSTISQPLDQHGKRLGFISQEIGREINTIGSKANSSDIQHHVINMKEELEKIKEQTLNIL